MERRRSRPARAGIGRVDIKLRSWPISDIFLGRRSAIRRPMISTVARPVLKLDDHTLLERLLSEIRAFPARPGEEDATTVRRWLLTTETGRALNDYIAEEAGTLAAAADRLNLSGDPELREISGEVGRAANRLSALAGVPATLLDDRS
jgi:hypothetical protein